MAKTMIYLLLLSTIHICFSNAESVIVEFDMTDRQVPESRGPCDVLLSKRGKLAEDLNVRVRALTIAQYENLTGTTFPGDIPAAEANDLDSSYEQIFTFEANADFRQSKPVAVNIVDDDVNEANEEFLLYFDIPNLPSSVSITTQTGRNPVRCRIMNDDDVKIGFERGVYTVEEGTDLESQVFITKADGFSTEEDIDIRITAIPQTAQLGNDYTTPNGGRQFNIEFFASQNKIGVPVGVLSNAVSGDGNRNFYLQFSGSGVRRLVNENTVTQIFIVDATPPSPSPSPVPSPSPSSSSPAPSLTLPSLPEPVITVVNPVPSSPPVLTNVPQQEGPMTTVFPRATNVPIDREDCEDKENDEDLGLAIGLTFLVTFLLTALCAAVIIVFVVIADRRRRENRYQHQQLS